MHIVALTTTAAALALGVSVAATAQPGPGPRGDFGPTTRAEVETRTDQAFARMDVNKDGKIDSADRDAREVERFTQLDKDGNGQLSQDEFFTSREGMRGPKDHPEGRARMNGRHGGPMGGPMFGMSDANGDQSITAEEFKSAALARFDQQDANKDGTISAEEREASRSAMREQWKHRGERPPMAPSPEAQ